MTTYLRSHSSIVDIILQNIPDLETHPNGTRTGFEFIILEEELDLMDVPYINIEDNIFLFWDYDSQFDFLPHS